MGDSCAFAVEVVRTVCERFASRATELELMTETGSSFEGWLAWEAFLACKQRQAGHPFCEVTARPTYASEGVADESDPARDVGGLRVGGPNDGADHCWLFAEIVLLYDGNRPGGGWRRQLEAEADKLLRLGWKKSASLLLPAVVSRGDGLTAWAGELTGCEIANRPPLTEPFVIMIPGGGTVVLMAIDVKRDPADTLTATRH